MEEWGGRLGEALDRAPHGRGHEGADVTCVSSHPSSGEQPGLAACLPGLWPSLPGAAREIL